MSKLAIAFLIGGPILVLASLTALDGMPAVQVFLLVAGGAMACVGLLLDDQPDTPPQPKGRFCCDGDCHQGRNCPRRKK